ncbi:hypothetical protein [Oceanibacterium hippocampi]|nr:hypothetical protein [Oceanibacterium hippocampi]
MSIWLLLLGIAVLLACAVAVTLYGMRRLGDRFLKEIRSQITISENTYRRARARSLTLEMEAEYQRLDGEMRAFADKFKRGDLTDTLPFAVTPGLPLTDRHPLYGWVDRNAKRDNWEIVRNLEAAREKWEEVRVLLSATDPEAEALRAKKVEAARRATDTAWQSIGDASKRYDYDDDDEYG